MFQTLILNFVKLMELVMFQEVQAEELKEAALL